MTDTAALFTRLAELDGPTLATVTAAFGRTPSVSDLDPDEAERLAAIVDAVEAGTQAARAAAVAELDELPPLPPPDVDPLRARVRALDEPARAALLQRWAEAGLPGLANPDGSSVMLPREVHRRLEQLIATAEPPVDAAAGAELVARWRALPPGPRSAVDARIDAQGIRDALGNPLTFTTGRALTLEQILADVEVEADAIVAEALGPVLAGSVVTETVDTVDELALVPPTGKVAEVLAWVAGSAERARAALEAEQRRKSPRSSLVDKLAPLAGGPITPAPAPAAGHQIAPVGGGASGDSLPVAVEAPPAPLTGASLDPDLEQAVAPAEVAEGLLIELHPIDDWPPLKALAYIGRLAAELKVAVALLERFHAEAVARREAAS